jgi:nitrate reductase gamma subunit
MDLLDWARGPLLELALLVFFGGVAWRLWHLWRLPQMEPVAPARQHVASSLLLKAAWGRMLPRTGFHPSATLVTVNPYIFHIGLALVFFGYAPHIAFIQRLTGLHWPALPDAVMYLAAAASIVSLLLALLFRLTDPVLRCISHADDHISWTVTLLPLLTGMGVVGEPSSALLAHAEPVYRTPLAIHLLSLELLLIWFPFGKLMHTFLALPNRMQLARFLARRGVRP